MPTESGLPTNERAAPGAPPRQRWRLEVAQPAATEEDRRAAGAAGSWAGILARSGLPIAGEGSRLRVAPAAPLPLGIAGEREVVDVFLAARVPVAAVRDALGAALPDGWSLVGLHDVWVGAAAAPATVVAADYRVVVAGAPAETLGEAAGALLAAPALARPGRRDRQPAGYDLRPLLAALEVREADAAGVTIAMRLRHGPAGVGRPEEVVAALGEPPAPPLPGPLRVVSITRERLVLAGDAGGPADEVPGG